LTPARWREIKEIAADALELPVPERELYILRACGEDSALIDEVHRVVAADASDSAGPLDRPLPVRWADPSSLPVDTVLAGRFQILGLIAKGGMGEVYRALDQNMHEEVALKIIGRDVAGRPGVVDRFRHEVQRARRITHANVCRIHDLYLHLASDGASLQFLTMKLIAGPTLAGWIQSPEPKSIPQSLTLLVDVLGGLEAAHEAGIAHCDLKPSNVMIETAEGRRPRAIITDFGLARALRSDSARDATHTGFVGGAPAYLAPELRFGTGGGVAVDIYAFGLIAYELLTGSHPFDRKPAWEVGPDWRIALPSSLAPGVPPAWETAILRCLELEPAARFHSIAELRAAVGDPHNTDSAIPFAAKPARLPRWPVLATAFAAVLAAIAWWVVPPRVPAAHPSRHILVSSIDNQTGQSLLDNTLRELVTAMLEQSPVVKLYPQSKVPEALRLMGKPESSNLDIATALEICQREGLEGIVTGSVMRAGAEYLIVLKALDPQGTTVASSNASAASLDLVIRAAEDASGKLRTSLGESAASIRQSRPLERVTSPALQAVQYYSLGKIQLNAADPKGAETLFHRAIEIDSKFAMAHAYLGNVYEHLGDMTSSQKELSIAAQLSDRVSEPEKLKIAGDYNFALEDYGEAVKYYELLIRIRPEMAAAHLNLGQAYFELRNYDRALAETDAASQIDPQIGFAINAVEILLVAGRCGEAISRANRIQGLPAKDSRLRYLVGRCYLADGDIDRASRIFEEVCTASGTEQADGCSALADLSRARNEIGRARTNLQRAVAADRKIGNEYGAESRLLGLAILDAPGHDASLDGVIDLSKIENDVHLSILAIELCRTTSNAGKLREIVNRLERRRSVHRTPRSQFLFAIAQSVLAAIENRSSAAVDWAKTAAQYDNSSFVIDLLGQYYAAAGMNREAILQFESVLARSNERMESYDDPAFHRLIEVHRELARLYRASGDNARALPHLAAAARFTN
jgi:serine/threonine protein kinase/tetratricopeptide (TPR) repeat protein